MRGGGSDVRSGGRRRAAPLAGARQRGEGGSRRAWAARARERWRVSAYTQGEDLGEGMMGAHIGRREWYLIAGHAVERDIVLIGAHGWAHDFCGTGERAGVNRLEVQGSSESADCAFWAQCVRRRAGRELGASGPRRFGGGRGVGGCDAAARGGVCTCEGRDAWLVEVASVPPSVRAGDSLPRLLGRLFQCVRSSVARGQSEPGCSSPS